MDHSQRTSENWDRLRELAREVHVPIEASSARLQVPGPQPMFEQAGDRQRAEELLRCQKEARLGSNPPIKSRLFGSKPRPDQHKDKEICETLTALVRNNGSPGVAEVLVALLIEKGGDVNISRRGSKSTLKRLKGENQADERSRVLQVATENGHVDMVRVLVRRADEISLDESLGIAVNASHTAITRILLDHGANASLYQAQFRAAVQRGEEELVDLMIRARKPIPLECISESLVLASTLPVTSVLARNGADGDYRDAAALVQAITNGQLDLCIAITLGQKPPSPLSLDRGVGLAFNNAGMGDDKKFRLIEALLCGGAAGDATADTLVQCCREERLQFVELLVRHGVSIQYNDAEALSYAVRRCHLEIVDLLLLATLIPEYATLVFSNIEESAPQEIVCSLMVRLLERGAAGIVLDEALMEFVKRGYLDAVKVLISYGASVDHRDAWALGYTISKEQIPIFRALLKGRPTLASLEKTFPQTRDSRVSWGGRLVMTKALLEAGARGQVVDDALLEAVQDPKSRDDTLITTLLGGGANVNSREGKCIQAVVRQADVELLKLLLQNSPSKESTSSSIPLAMSITNTRARYDIIKLLLSNHASGDCVAQALVDSIVKYPTEGGLQELLLIKGHADINYKGGESICAAVSSLVVGILERLMQFGTPDINSISNALPFAIRLKSSDPNKVDILELLLKKVKPQHAIDSALIEEFRINQGPDYCSAGVLNILLEAGANVNHQGGESVRLSVQSGSIRGLELLLVRNPDTGTLNNAFPSAIELRPIEARLRVCQMLLEKGVSASIINQALVTTIEEKGSGAEDLAKLLLRFRACVDFNGGRAISIAVKNVLRVQLRQLMHAHQKPSPRTLQSAFSIAMGLPADDDRFDVFEILLEAGAKGESVSEALIRDTGRGDPGFRFCNLLLHHGASVEHSGGKAVYIAASSGFIPTLEILLAQQPTLSVLVKAFESVWTLNRDNRYLAIKLLLGAGMTGNSVEAALVQTVKESPCEHRLVKLLLGSNTSVLPEAAVYCATNYDHKTLSILLESVQSKAVTAAAFKAAMVRNVWRSTDGLLVMQLLLGKHSLRAAHAALVEAATHHMQPTARGFADLLSRHSASVNHNRGEALQVASSHGDAWFIRRLLKMSPSTDSISMAFPYLFMSPVDEEALVGLIDIFVQHGGEPLDFGFRHPHFLPVLFLSLDRHPRWAKALDTLITAGYPITQKITRMAEGGGGQEHVSLLYWALDQKEKRISDSSIEVIIDHDANVNFTTPLSKKTPLLLAASALRHHIVQKLVQRGADSEVVDESGISPLAYASQKGAQSIVKELVGTAGRNDGSLHDAARELHVETMQILLVHGHHPNFPSMRHGGRSALGELCRKASNIRHGSNTKKFSQAIHVLLDAGANIRLRTKGKSALMLALDNADPYPVTEAVLKNFMWEGGLVNEDFNLYCAPNGLCYSPAMYIKKNIYEGPPSEKQSLTELLEVFNCEDRYYATKGPQPEDCIGLPPDIDKAERSRREREQEIANRTHDHELRLQQEREREELAQSINRKRHVLALAKSDESAEREIARLELMANAKMRVKDQESVQEATIADHRHKQYLEHQTEQDNQRLAFKQKENDAALELVKSKAMVEQRALEAREKVEKEARRDKERLLKLVMEARPAQKQIGWGSEDVD